MGTTGRDGPGSDDLDRERERAVAAFRELEPRLRLMIEKRIAPRLRGRIDVDVILQNALGGLLRTLETRRPATDAELRSWICRRAWSRWQDELRRWSTEGRDAGRVGPLPPEADAAQADGAGAATDLSLKETVERVRAALRPVDFQIVELRIVDELSYEELGAFLGLTPESVRKRFYRALLKVRHLVSSPFSSSS